jgi:eukaryotic-like serine/threonine-protein kinase
VRRARGSPAVVYYVMPFIDGGTLRDRLDRDKQLPIDEALAIAREVADALGYARGRCSPR